MHLKETSFHARCFGTVADSNLYYESFVTMPTLPKDLSSDLLKIDNASINENIHKSCRNSALTAGIKVGVMSR